MKRKIIAPLSASLSSKADAIEDRLKVFVHLAANKDAEAWLKAWHSRTLVGINDETPYGYGRALRMDCEIDFSRTSREWLLTKVLRLGLRVLTGFDLIHAFRQRQALLAADVVWTHTESQYLAIAALFVFSKKRPKILGQSIWLFDQWDHLNPFHKLLYRYLIGSVDVLTFHSTENLAVARALFPDKRVLLVPFGIPSEQMIAPVVRPTRPMSILSIGNDRHRDWECLAAALDDLPDASAVILSGSASGSLTRGRPNLKIMQARNNTELFARFAEASVVCVPLKPNRHASGITVIQEAILAGVPVIATLTGGLDGYFGADVVYYVPPGNPQALREAIEKVVEDPEEACARTVRAQRHMLETGIGAETFVRRHVTISRELVGR